MYTNIIVLPYRNRQSHLEYFIKNSWPLIEKNLENSKLVIIEQNEGKTFNKGMLLNISYDLHKESKYLIFNDVDINPTEKSISLYQKIPEHNEIISIYSAECAYLGGILKIKTDDFKEINGFPNNFWGWGVEDKALHNRALYFDMKVQRNLLQGNTTDEMVIFNDIDDRHKTNNFNYKTWFHYEEYKNLSKEEQYKDIFSSGLNNLVYTVLERRNISSNIEIIKVDI